MPLPTGDIVGLMVDNLAKRKSVFPLSAKKSTHWADGLDLPRGGETVLYTGAMYQLIPSIVSMVRMLEKVEDTFLARWVFLGRFANRFVDLAAIGARPSRADRERFDRMLHTIARLLQHADVEFGYLYEDDIYAGALAHDMGADDTLQVHARRVHETLQRHGVKRVITVDPHTTNMLRTVYPEILDGFGIEVVSYLEVLAGADSGPLRRMERDVVIHDSCVYARVEGVIDEPRRLLERAGYTVREPRNGGALTFCCGGPIEALFPKRSREIGERRIEQLREAGDGAEVATMCPICLAALSEAAGGSLPLEDISLILWRASRPAEKATAATAG